jgi:preprotein translocase subunit YajC
MSNAAFLLSSTTMTLALPQDPTAPAPGPAATGAAPAAGTTQAPAGDAGAAGAPQQPCGTDTFLMMGLFAAMMWLMVLRPESKRRKETQSMLSALKQGDTVVTIGGMYGKVATIADKTVVLRIDTQMVTFDRSAIARVVVDDAAQKKA